MVRQGDRNRAGRGAFQVWLDEHDVRAAYGTTLCPAARRHGSRFDYVPFNDARVWNPDNGLAIVLPPKPSGPGGNRITTTTYAEATGPTNVTISSFWEVTIEYPEPPP